MGNNKFSENEVGYMCSKVRDNVAKATKLATLREVGTKLDVMADKVTGIKDREEKLEALLREIVCIGYWLEAKIKEAEK